ncbi:fungal zn(2)-Cys(6) binuclear cluster domain-containing protein [Rhizoctonia solani AG-1 IA]|uniref:Fungal zn(2)-Cys(6) binuclear cluster domain-containing protein n=1 Tax=Thanatephorus cucumeris (strain AG1-IA) TaxID=983506 RepID=L8WNK5_THACA|nr:fungal zn(2)-Cys(6) binuclear cluster domain-containing protein [Rhizoctonia solani AG-1 IA]
MRTVAVGCDSPRADFMEFFYMGLKLKDICVLSDGQDCVTTIGYGSTCESVMSVPRRSTTGCTTCKVKRKKCDEAKPRCSRCLASRAVCLYEYVEHPEYIHRIKRTKPAPRPPRAPKMAYT